MWAIPTGTSSALKKKTGKESWYMVSHPELGSDLPIGSDHELGRDNDIGHNPIQHDYKKHDEVDRFFIKEKVDLKIVKLPKIKSKDQLVDILTKAVSYRTCLYFLGKLGMCDIYAST